MGNNSGPFLADLFLHTFDYDFTVKIMKQDITKAIQFRNTFRYIDYLFSINNVDFGNYISAIYPLACEQALYLPVGIGILEHTCI